MLSMMKMIVTEMLMGKVDSSAADDGVDMMTMVMMIESWMEID